MPITIITDHEPVSVNAGKKDSALKNDWENHIKDVLKTHYPLPAGKTTHYTKKQRLYFLMTYFNKGAHPDLDNIIKYTSDAFSGYAFPDDSKVMYYVSQCVFISPNDITSIDVDGLPETVVSELVDYILGQGTSTNKRSRTVVECGLFDPKMIKYNLEEVWK